jgi:Tfp pilus assembly protein PilF
VARKLKLLGRRKQTWLAGLVGAAAATLLFMGLGQVDVATGCVVVLACVGLAALNVREGEALLQARLTSLVEEARQLTRDGVARQAQDRLAEVLRLDPGNDQAHLLLSAVHRATHDEAGALEILRRGVVENPKSARNHYHLAMYHLEKGDTRAGGSELIQALECDEHLLDAYFALGFVYESDHEKEKAARCYQEMLWMSQRWPKKRPLDYNPLNLEKAERRLAALQPTASKKAQ